MMIRAGTGFSWNGLALLHCSIFSVSCLLGDLPTITVSCRVQRLGLALIFCAENCEVYKCGLLSSAAYKMMGEHNDLVQGSWRCPSNLGTTGKGGHGHENEVFVRTHTTNGI
jgi:hypothetical protein